MAYKHDNLLVIGYIGQQLKKIRESKGLTMADVSKEIGYVGSAIGNWEQGKTNIAMDVLYTYCWYLGVDPVDVMPSPQYIHKLKQKLTDNV